VRPNPFGNFVVGDQILAVGSAPGRQQADVHPGGVHRGDSGVDRQFVVGNLPAGPALQRREEVTGQEPLGRMLHPHVDRHRVRL
jgi:hypothetical protein